MTRTILPSLIRATYGRDATERVLPHFQDYYAATAGSLWSSLVQRWSADIEGPHLVVVHSPVAKPQTISVAEGRFLVYDQYLGQTFSRLTRHQLSDAPPDVLDPYFMKVYAQRCLIIGRFETAATFAIARAGMGDHSPPPEEADVRAKRAALVGIQEAFTIAHELVHTLLSVDPSDTIERRQWYVELMETAFLNDGVEAEAQRAASQQYAQDIRTAIERRGLDPTRLDPAAMVAPPDKRRSRKATLDRVRLDADLSDECLCDAFALVAVVEVLAPSQGLVPSIDGCVLALHNLRLLQYLDRLAADDSPSASWFEQSIDRLSLFRTFSMTLPLLSGRADLVQEVFASSVEINKQHARVLMDQLLFCTDFERLEGRIRELDGVTSAVERLAAAPADLRALLGFGPGDEVQELARQAVDVLKADEDL